MEALGTLEVARFPSVVTSVNVPVCVVSRCVFTSVAKCVLQRTHSAGERRCVRGTTRESEKACVDETPGMSGAPRVEEAACVRETARACEQPCGSEARCVRETPRVSVPACVEEKVCVKETPCVSGTTCASEIARVSERSCVTETACVRERYEREMAVGMRENETATACPSVMARCVSVMARGSVGVERRQRLRQLRDKGRVAAVVLMGTVPGLHGSERAVRAVQRTRPPRARLQE